MKILIEKKLGNVEFIYSYGGGVNFSHSLSYPNSLDPTDDALLRISYFSRPVNSKCYDVEGVTVNRTTKEYLQAYYDVSINVPVSTEIEYRNLALKSVPENIYLCFSGGFDSITSKAMLEDLADLVSIDFGGTYERESTFFKFFKTNIIKWELRGKRKGQKESFNELLDWHWMVSPPLLFQDKDKPLAIATGTILEGAGPWWFSGKKRPDFKQYNSCGYGPGVALVSPVASITEYATTLVASQYLNSEQLASSLKSLAAPNSLKAFRKKVLLSIIQDKSIPDASTKMLKHRFGSGFGDDFMALYFYWKLGKDWVLENYVDLIPEEAASIDMSFAEKIHQYNLDALDRKLSDHLLGKLKGFGLNKLYTDNDFNELEKVKAIIQ